ncbi:MAG: NB-ARC domain-containing protein, partial [Jiangellaceae bacterium]
MGGRGRGFRPIDLLPVVVAALAVPLGIVTNIATKDGKFWEPFDAYPRWWLLGIAAASCVVTLVSRWLEWRGQRTNLPPAAPVPEWREWTVERKLLLGRVLRALCRRRLRPRAILTVLLGAGGMGKTTLARMACAHRRVGRRFRGRVYWITVGRDARQPAEIAGRVNALIELISGEPGGSADPRVAGQHLGRLLDQSPRSLLVIDDVWDADQLEPFLVGGRRCARMVTTRVRNAVPATAVVVPVGKMSADEGGSVLRRDVAGLGPTEVDALLAATGRWPLLLRLINRAIADEAATGVHAEAATAEILRRLAQAGPTATDASASPLLAALDDPDLRRRAVRATIEASTRLLDRDEPARLAELSIFTEDEAVPRAVVETLWAATAGMDPPASRRLCRRLADLSLISLDPADGGTVTLHDMVRDYLRADLDALRLAALNAVLVDALGADLPPASDLVPGVRPAATAWWEADHCRYVWDNLVRHLLAAGRLAEAEATVGDLRWVRRRLLLFGVGALLRDLAHVPTDRTNTLRASLMRCAHLLSRTDPAAAVLDVLQSRLAEEDAFRPQLQALAAPADRHGLRSRWPLPDLPATANPLSVVDTSAMALAPDGTWLATGGRDGRVFIRDIGTSEVLRVLPAHRRSVMAIAVASDSVRFATGGHDGTVHVWRSGRCEPERSVRLPGSSDSVEALVFLPDGQRLVVFVENGTLWLWDLPTGALSCLLVERLRESGPPTIAEDGTWLRSSARSARSSALRWTGTALHARLGLWRSRRHAGFPLVMSPDGSWIACREWDTAWVLRLDGDDAVTALRGGPRWVKALAVTPDGAGLTAGWGDQVWTWEIATGAVRQQLRCPGASALVYGPDGAWLAVGDEDGTVRIVDSGTGATSRRLVGHAGTVRALAVTADGKKLASRGYDEVVRVWELEVDGGFPSADTAEATAVAVHPDARWFAVGDERGEIALRDPVTGAVRNSVRPCPSRINSLAVDPGGEWAAVATPAGIHLWDVAAHTFRHA